MDDYSDEFVTWINRLEHEPGEFTVYWDDWYPLFEKGLTPSQAFAQVLAALRSDADAAHEAQLRTHERRTARTSEDV